MAVSITSISCGRSILLTPLGKPEMVLTGIAVSASFPGFPAPSLPSIAHFSAKDFFRDSPWLNVPMHRKADILVEPLYPGLGLLGGAPEAGGKMSKLAALAAARKKKEGEKTPSPAPTPEADSAQPSRSATPSKGAPLSLSERLARNGKPSKSSDSLQSPSPAKGSRLGSPASPKKPSPEPPKPSTVDEPRPSPPADTPTETKKEEPEVNIMAPPSTFASTIVGDAIRPKAEPSHLSSNTLDLIKIYGQDLTEPFDFTGPSPDDVVLNAQSSAKGLAIRRKI